MCQQSLGFIWSEGGGHRGDGGSSPGQLLRRCRAEPSDPSPHPSTLQNIIKRSKSDFKPSKDRRVDILSVLLVMKTTAESRLTSQSEVSLSDTAAWRNVPTCLANTSRVMKKMNKDTEPMVFRSFRTPGLKTDKAPQSAPPAVSLPGFNWVRQRAHQFTCRQFRMNDTVQFVAELDPHRSYVCSFYTHSFLNDN